MKSKNRLLGIAAAMGLMLSMSICAGAADYHFEGSQGAEYYSATSYESVYGAQYRVGGANAVDYQWPKLPYGTTGGTGCMEKVYLPAGTILSGTGDVSGIPSDIWSEEVPASSLWQTAFTDAGTMTRKDGSIGTLAIPSLGIQMRVWEGETNQSMAKGLGHYRSTSGWDGNVGICGHNRGAKYVIGTIKDLKVGDVITYTTAYGTRTYQVSSVNTILNTDWSYLQATADNRVTLTTCLANHPEYRVCVQAIEKKM